MAIRDGEYIGDLMGPMDVLAAVESLPFGGAVEFRGAQADRALNLLGALGLTQDRDFAMNVERFSPDVLRITKVYKAAEAESVAPAASRLCGLIHNGWICTQPYGHLSQHEARIYSLSDAADYIWPRESES